MPKDLLTVVPNGVDTDRAEDRAAGSSGTRFGAPRARRASSSWLAVGRFEIAKDYPNMLRAFARVRERQPGAVLLLVGRGALQAETEALVRQLGLRAR